MPLKSPLAYIAPENQVAVKWQQRQGTTDSLNQNVSSDNNGVNGVLDSRNADGSYMGWFNPDSLDCYISIMENAEPQRLSMNRNIIPYGSI